MKRKRGCKTKRLHSFNFGLILECLEVEKIGRKFTWGLHRVYMGFVRRRQRDDGEI